MKEKLFNLEKTTFSVLSVILINLCLEHILVFNMEYFIVGKYILNILLYIRLFRYFYIRGPSGMI